MKVRMCKSRLWFWKYRLLVVTWACPLKIRTCKCPCKKLGYEKLPAKFKHPVLWPYWNTCAKPFSKNETNVFMVDGKIFSPACAPCHIPQRQSWHIRHWDVLFFPYQRYRIFGGRWIPSPVQFLAVPPSMPPPLSLRTHHKSHLN